ncbi:MAG TPA: helix-turn-helix domain-containing protein [Solirubrobacterales bacterium]|nr:helix-turn-helix domain-containing protein [Solirubrobacterales bacterium]
MPTEKKTATPEEALHTILQHPLRKELLRLIVEAGEELRSPKELTVPVDESISSVGYHVRVLAEYGAVELIDKQPRRGAIEHFYEATSLVDEVPWGRLALGLPPSAPNDFPNRPSRNKEEQHERQNGNRHRRHAR